jgi:cellulose synthase/poly-beta-1,6-N-acetylglucosamine synthase-like glycosyltransferase
MCTKTEGTHIDWAVDLVGLHLYNGGFSHKRRIANRGLYFDSAERASKMGCAPKTLPLIIPCYNEELTLAECVKRVLAIATNDLRLELIIVDDCSSDDSLLIAVKSEICWIITPGPHPFLRSLL